jgi:hypothetical protein
MLEAKSTIRPTVRRTLDGVSRLCAHPLCSQQAAFTLSYEYRHGRVWIDELSGDRNPHTYDLCRRHTGSLTVPLGWQTHDRRLSVPVEHGLVEHGLVEHGLVEHGLAGYGHR